MCNSLEVRNFIAIQGTKRSSVNWRQGDRQPQDTREVIPVSRSGDGDEVVVMEMEDV